MNFAALQYNPLYSNPRLLCTSRCGNASADLALKFNSPTKERDVIAMLDIAVMDGILGNFIVLPSTGTVVCPSTPRSSSDGKFIIFVGVRSFVYFVFS